VRVSGHPLPAKAEARAGENRYEGEARRETRETPHA
jgi:hypothetical protein